MARTLISTVVPAKTGTSLVPTAGDATNQHFYVWQANRRLVVSNQGGSPINVTIGIPDTVDGDLASTDRVVAVAVAGILVIDTARTVYKQANGQVLVDLSVATSVKLGVLES